MFSTPSLKSTAASYQIDNSLIFNDDDSAYLSRTPAAGTQTKWTYNTRIKRANIDTFQSIFCAGSSTSYELIIRFTSSNTLEVYDWNGAYRLQRITTQVFRDVGAYYDLCFVLDTTQATATDRFKIYVNGSQVTSFSTEINPALNATLVVNDAVAHTIAARFNGTEFFYDGYVSETHFIDGQALTPSDFGEDDGNGNWSPKAYTGTYGTNGFFLEFKDNSTAAALGTDTSGNGNTWTVNGITASDQTKDTPTDNACVFNLLAPTYNGSFTEGNTLFTTTATAGEVALGSIQFPDTGRWYFEFSRTEADVNWAAGINTVDTGDYAGHTNGISHFGTSIYVNGSVTQTGLTAIGISDTLGIAIDSDAGTVQFYRNGVAAGTTESFSGDYFPACGNYVAGMTYVINCGGKTFTYTPPTGFKALSTANLPDPVIAKPSDYFNPVLYTGDGTASKAITGVNFQSDLTWIKNRIATDNHKLIDSVRGVTNEISSNLTSAQVANADGLLSFDADGFTVGADLEYNTSGETYVAWNWLESVTAGLDILTYQATGISGQVINHNLGVVPELILVKKHRINGADGDRVWAVYSKEIGATNALIFNQTNPQLAATWWNNTTPTSVSFQIGGGAGNQEVGYAGDDYIAYLFASVEGYSKFGSYIGNSSADGPFVNCGFRPRWLVIKNSSTDELGGASWLIYDTLRSPFNAADDRLYGESTATEQTNLLYAIDILSNGFKIRDGTANYGFNNTGETYIYMAFAESPFKTANAR